MERPARSVHQLQNQAKRALPQVGGVAYEISLPLGVVTTEAGSETEAGVKELMSLFPVAAFEGTLPPIILRHQLYSILSDRTMVDRELVSLSPFLFRFPSFREGMTTTWGCVVKDVHVQVVRPCVCIPHPCHVCFLQLALRDSGKVRLFKLGVSEDQYCLVWTEDYRSHLRTVLGRSQLCNKFLRVVLPGNQEVSITRVQLREEMRLSEEEITYVVTRVTPCSYIGKDQTCSFELDSQGVIAQLQRFPMTSLPAVAFASAGKSFCSVCVGNFVVEFMTMFGAIIS